MESLIDFHGISPSTPKRLSVLALSQPNQATLLTIGILEPGTV